jgi:hypothetical protein
VLDVPDGLGEAAARWHLALWDPWWITGGVLILVAAARSGAGSADSGTEAATDG